LIDYCKVATAFYSVLPLLVCRIVSGAWSWVRVGSADVVRV